MSEDRQNIVMVYLISDDGSKVLLEFHKNPMDPSYNRYNGIDSYPGKEESLIECAERAIVETGVLYSKMEYKGTVHWSKFDPKDAPLFGHFFTAEVASNSPFIAEDSEVRRKWIDKKDILESEIPCWPGDAYIMPEIFSDSSRPFQAVMVYHNGLPALWRVQRL